MFSYCITSDRATPSAQQLYRKIVKKVNSTEPTYKQQLKRQIAQKYDKHLSLLQSHRKRQLRFQHNFTTIQKQKEQNDKRIKLAFKQKQDKIKKSKVNYLSQKKKRIQDSLLIWQNTVSQNQRKYFNRIQQSDGHIRKWNQKCQQSISKKNQRLHSISSNLSERSRILSAKTLKNNEQMYESLLQRALINPQGSNSKSKQNIERSKRRDTANSRISSSSRVSTQVNLTRFQKSEKQKLSKYLQSLLKKQAQIIQARNKKTQLITQLKKQRQQKQMQLDYVHKQNNYYLSNRRSQMELKLDSKFTEERRNQKQRNGSLPGIKSKISRQDNLFQKNSIFNTLKVKQPQNRTAEPCFDRLIIQQLRNITLVSKMKRLKK